MAPTDLSIDSYHSQMRENETKEASSQMNGESWHSHEKQT